MRVSLVWQDEALCVFDYEKQVPNCVTVRTVRVEEFTPETSSPLREMVERWLEEKWQAGDTIRSQEALVLAAELRRDLGLTGELAFGEWVTKEAFV